jgi:hypothetical protein
VKTLDKEYSSYKNRLGRLLNKQLQKQKKTKTKQNTNKTKPKNKTKSHMGGAIISLSELLHYYITNAHFLTTTITMGHAKKQESMENSWGKSE